MSQDLPIFKPRPVDLDSVLLLRTLIGAETAFVSGSTLAKQLGVSRPAIHGKLTKLREEGFLIEAVRNRGYRLLQLPEVLHPALLRCSLEQVGSTIHVFSFSAIDSTNSEAERRYASRERSPFAVVASCQTNGRGRLGRVWHSVSTENLYLSVLFEPNIPAQHLQLFTLWAGIYICRTLQLLVPSAALKIKWPNDLHCGGRKFAGMLTEAKMDADGIRCIVFGLGLNINCNPNHLPADIRHLATSLHAIRGESLPLNEVAARVIHAIEQAYAHCMENTKSLETLVEAWKPLDALAGKQVTAMIGGREISGVASGIDASGALLLAMPDGTVEAIRAGDVTLKK